MDPNIDDFISYDNLYNSRAEPLLDHDLPLSSPFSESSELSSLFPSFLPKTIKNLLDSDSAIPFSDLISLEPTQLEEKESELSGKDRKEDTTDISEQLTDMMESPGSVSSKVKAESSLNTKTKKITKQEKQEKPRKKKTAEAFINSVDSKFIPEGFDDPNLDEKTKKKMIQMIRNRVSAQNSRDKKKQYVQELEEVRETLIEENVRLEMEKAQMAQRIKKLEEAHALLLKENEALKKNTASSMCYKCGHTFDFNNGSEALTQENTDGSSPLTNLSSPIIQRGSGRGGNFFGFAFAFATVLCMVLMANSDLGFGNFGISGSVPSKGTTLMTYTKNIMRQMESDYWSDSEKSSKPERSLTENIKAALQKPFSLTKFSIQDTIKPLMDNFEVSYENLYETHERTKVVLNLANRQVLEAKLSKSKSTLSNPSRGSGNNTFLGKKIIKSANRTSTLFCPTGFELFQKKNIIDEEIENNPFQEGFPSDLSNTKNSPSEFEKADYIHLLLPKGSVSKLGVTDNHSEVAAHPLYSIAEDENTLVEIWCKVFAVREVATSL